MGSAKKRHSFDDVLFVSSSRSRNSESFDYHLAIFNFEIKSGRRVLLKTQAPSGRLKFAELVHESSLMLLVIKMVMV